MLNLYGYINVAMDILYVYQTWWWIYDIVINLILITLHIIMCIISNKESVQAYFATSTHFVSFLLYTHTSDNTSIISPIVCLFIILSPILTWWGRTGFTYVGISLVPCEQWLIVWYLSIYIWCTSSWQWRYFHRFGWKGGPPSSKCSCCWPISFLSRENNLFI